MATACQQHAERKSAQPQSDYVGRQRLLDAFQRRVDELSNERQHVGCLGKLTVRETIHCLRQEERQIQQVAEVVEEWCRGDQLVPLDTTPLEIRLAPGWRGRQDDTNPVGAFERLESGDRTRSDGEAVGGVCGRYLDDSTRGELLVLELHFVQSVHQEMEDI